MALDFTAYSAIPSLVRAASTQYADRSALRVWRAGQWHLTSYAQLWQQVEAVAALLISHGVAAGDRVAIFAKNAPEWTIADLAIMSTGAVTVPIYATSTGAQATYILNDSGAVVLFMGDPERDRVGDVRAACSALTEVIALSQLAAPHPAPAPDSAQLQGAQSAEVPEVAGRAEVADRLAAIGLDDLCAIIYTSGTTGEPKGVMLTHGNLLHQGRVISQRFDFAPGRRNMCFLPLSHAFERAWNLVIVLPMGMENSYVSDPKTVADEMTHIRAHTFVSVPRLYEKVFAKATLAASKNAVTTALFGWSLAIGTQYHRALLAGKRVNPLLRAQFALADRLVLHNVRDGLGGHKYVMAAGGAPLRREIEEFFFATGETVYQGYGLTETSPVVTCNYDGALRFGTCGTTVPDCEVRIGDEGEILVRGDNVMKGYWNRPQDTAAVLDADGWFHTGDVGFLDEDGFLVITDRIKDLIITAQGKNVAPAPIEGALAASPLVDTAVVIGDERAYLTALIQPSFPDLLDLAVREGWPQEDLAALVAHPAVIERYDKVLATVNAEHAPYERIKAFRLLPIELSMDDGHLTPTLKVRRRVVEAAFAPLVEQMYAERSW